MISVTKGIQTVGSGLKKAAKQGLSVKNGAMRAAKNCKNNLSDRWCAANRLAKKKNMGFLDAAGTKIKAITTRTRIKKEDGPYLMAFLGFCSMIPGGTTAGFVLGKGFNKIKDYIKKNQNES